MTGTGRPLKSFLLGLTAGGYIALGFVFHVANFVGAPTIVGLVHAGGTWRQAAFGDLTCGALVVDNLLPVTLGNVVCGGVMVGILCWTIFHYVAGRKDSPEQGGKGIASGAGA
ncbi:hypothetical protein ACPYO6_05825 [Georgenia sp. Z1344]|uniref:hypothetical protein n=1 Tax=Georgenia sp. Z1344 TaxID=3416706 RepID=UPI003CF7EF4D